jgi:hypothetical protein
MIVTRAEVLSLTRYSTSDTDDLALIDTLIPYVQEDLCDYLNNYFHDYYVTYVSGSISFVKGSPDTITDGESEFVKKRFVAGQDIHVESGTLNDGIHELATVAAGTLTLTSTNELYNIAYDDGDYNLGGVRISAIDWPKSLKLVAARMVKYLLDRSDKIDGTLSEVQDGVSQNYDRARTYPREILGMADKYKRLEFC